MISFQGWFRHNRLDSELAEEMDGHIDERAAELMEQGISAKAAREQARREFGNPGVLRERSRDVWGWTTFDDFIRTVMHAQRALRHGGAFTAVSILTLALGIGANTAMFTLIDATLLKPLPYRSPERLVRTGLILPGFHRPAALTPEFVAWRSENHSFEGLVAWNDEEPTLTGAGEPQRLSAATVNHDFLSVLGVRPMMGRDFRAEDDRPGAPMVALISDRLWRHAFGGRPAFSNREVALDDMPVTVIGVLPPDFLFPDDMHPDVLLPSQLGDKPDWRAMTMGILSVVGRLKPDVSAAAATADLNQISRRHEREKPVFLSKNAAVETISLATFLVGDVRAPLLTLFAAAIAVLLIACLNVANLQLSRFNVRIRELAVRAALGAGKLRLLWLVVTECLLLSSAGAAAGIGLAWALIRLARRYYELLHLSSPDTIRLNGEVAAFCVGVTAVSALLFAAAPALLTQGTDLRSGLQNDGTRLASGLRNLFRSALMVGEVTMAVMLLLGAGLLLRSFERLMAVAPGFQAQGVASLSVSLPGSRYPDAKRQSAFVSDLVTRLRALPGVAGAGVSSSPPLTPYHLGASIYFEGRPVPPPGSRPSTPVISVTPGYFEAIGVPLLAGRFISEGDAAGAPWVCVVNTAFVQKYFSSQNPLGRRIQWGGLNTHPWATIVGVVADTRHLDLANPPEPEVYTSFDQFPNSQVTALLRTAIPPSAILSAAQASVLAIDKQEAVFDATTMEERVNRSRRDRRVATFLLGGFAFLALCLAATGVYGVMSYSVVQSTREIGVRMALGATQRRVASFVLRRALVLSLIGVLSGSALAAYCARFLQTFLYGVGSRDPLTFGTGVVVLMLVSLLATYVPARRAARVDPVEALRAE